jgi:hypothetical protein
VRRGRDGADLVSECTNEDGRAQTADGRRQTADRRPQAAGGRRQIADGKTADRRRRRAKATG